MLDPTSLWGSLQVRTYAQLGYLDAHVTLGDLPTSGVRITPREVLPGVWHWRIDATPQTSYCLEGYYCETSGQLRDRLRHPQARQWYTEWDGGHEYSRVHVPADRVLR